MASKQSQAGLHREIAVLEKLQYELPTSFQLFHGITWQTLHRGQERHGELDIVVLAPNGVIVLLEIKAGAAQLHDGGLFKLYGHTEKDVLRQSRVQYAAMINKLQQAGFHAPIVNALVLPDFKILDKSSVLSFDASRIIDATVYEELSNHVMRWANDAGQTAKNAETINDIAIEHENLRQFLSYEFAVVTDVAAQAGDLRQASYRLADGLATWVPRLSVPSRQIRVQGTAGSGKSQLALRLLDKAIRDNVKALYVCFNRNLADVIRAYASAKVEVVTFHELAIEHFQKSNKVDFADGRVFESAAILFVGDAESFTPRFDVLIIDEGQDFEAEWVEALACMLKDDGYLYLMEDEAQRLYSRSEFDLPEATLVTCQDNYRSPRMICQTINALGLSPHAVTSLSPFDGDIPTIYTYDSTDRLYRQTIKAVDDLLIAGFAIEDIIVISYAGQSHSALFQLARDKGTLGSWPLCFVTGFDPAGNVVNQKGDLQLETLYRFKGQSKVAVVLAEIHFEQLTDADKRKLFVGLTRGLMSVSLVMSTQTELAISLALSS